MAEQNTHPKGQQLTPFSKRTPEERKELGSKGGKKRSENIKKRKSLESTLSMLLALPVKEERTKEAMLKTGVKKSDLKLQTQILLALIKQASIGNVRAFEAIRDTLGETTSKIQVENTVQDKEITGVNIKTIEVLRTTRIEGFEEFETIDAENVVEAECIDLGDTNNGTNADE